MYHSNNFEPVSRFYKIRRGHAIEDDLDAILFNPAASTIPKWRTFKLLRWMQNLYQLTWDHEILYADISSKSKEVLTGSFL
jgi:hypothetical protein